MSKKKKLALKIVLLVVLVLLTLSLTQNVDKAAPALDTSQTQSEDLCMSCHGKEDCEVDVDPKSLDQSAHKALLCSDCHLYVHKETPNLKLDMNNECVSCHASDLEDSIHSDSLSGGIGALCTDCHGIHNIKPVDSPDSSVYKLNVDDTCIKCHQDIMESYHYSFHGTAVNLGSFKAATCIDCHGTHNILPPTNPDSSVAKENVPDTCAKCHRSAQANFANGTEHVTPYDKDKDGAFWLWIVWKFFLGLILFDILKDCSIAIFELIRRARNRQNEKKNEHNDWDV